MKKNISLYEAVIYNKVLYLDILPFDIDKAIWNLESLRYCSFTPFPAYSRMGRGNLVLRHSILLTLLNLRDDACPGAEFITVLQNEKKIIRYCVLFFSVFDIVFCVQRLNAVFLSDQTVQF